MLVDYVLNGKAYGDVAATMQSCGYDPGYRRPYLDEHGRIGVTVNSGKFDEKGQPQLMWRSYEDCRNSGMNIPLLFNATALRKDDWIQLDTAILRAARQRLSAWSDLSAANSYGGFNAYAKTILEHETASDPGEAFVDMFGDSEGRQDAVVFKLEGIPLPITHSGFTLRDRQLAISRNSGTPLDTFQAEAAGRRVAELVEKTLIGTVAGIQYGKSTDYGSTSKVYGYRNHPSRNTKTDITAPTTGGWTPSTLVEDVLDMIDTLNDDRFYGPFMLYHSTNWSKYMNLDYSDAKGTNTLRERLLQIDQISDVRRLDFMDASSASFNILLVQMTSDVAQAINGMPLTTVQWESNGGNTQNFRVMAIMVPRLRADYYGRMGLMHGTTS
jgi:hypothetical protein